MSDRAFLAVANDYAASLPIEEQDYARSVIACLAVGLDALPPDKGEVRLTRAVTIRATLRHFAGRPAPLIHR